MCRETRGMSWVDVRVDTMAFAASRGSRRSWDKRDGEEDLDFDPRMQAVRMERIILSVTDIVGGRPGMDGEEEDEDDALTVSVLPLLLLLTDDEEENDSCCFSKTSL